MTMSYNDTFSSKDHIMYYASTVYSKRFWQIRTAENLAE